MNTAELHTVPTRDMRDMTEEAITHLKYIDSELVKSAHMPGDESLVIVGAVALQGALLFEGAVGTGKTHTAKTIAAIVGGKFGRIQGTADVMPTDITGGRIINPETRKWESYDGPIMSNIVFIDELNRIPSKSLSAILEAMQEKQVTIPGEHESRPLPKPSMVIATQNPHENSQGTNPVPMAGLDRFNVSILQQPLAGGDYAAVRKVKRHTPTRVVEPSALPMIKYVVENLAIDSGAEARAERLVQTIRDLDVVDRGESMLDGFRPVDETTRYAKAFALLQGEKTARNEHVDQAAFYTLRHRVGLTYESLDKNVTPEEIIDHVLDNLDK